MSAISTTQFSLLQPIDQGVIATFKANYLKFTFKKAIGASTREPAMLITEFYKQYNIKEALEHINTSLVKNI